jgi:zinc D-Ala-D-Ala dipeptidase
MKIFFPFLLFLIFPFFLFAQAPAGWSNMQTLDATIQTDIRYATTNNFVGVKMYDCAGCYFRTEMANALVKAHKELQQKGYGGLKFFDCYRPAPFQQRLWDAKPDARFVTPPHLGSMHSRGGAADLTIIDKNGNELDMGTGFDTFSPLSYQTATNLPKQVLENRALLRNTLKKYGLKHIRTEWWHFSYKIKYPVADWTWGCK